MPEDMAVSALQSREIVDEMLGRARRLAPVFRERADDGNQNRRAPDETIADIVAAQFVKIAQPAQFGGFEQPFSVISDVVMELARGDGSQAWVADVYCEHAYMLALFPEQAQHDVWDENPDALISASIVPVGNSVKKVDGGYVLNGRWPFLSGLHHSQWSILAEMVRQPDGSALHHFFLVPAADRAPQDDWHVLGLAGTGSASILIKDVFVPDHRVLRNADVMAGQTPGAKLHGNPIYRMPVFGYTVNGLGSVPIGVVTGMVDDFAAFVTASSKRPFPPPGLANLTERLAESGIEAEAARMMLRDSNMRTDAKLMAGAMLAEDDAARTMRNAAWAVMLARRAATRMFEVSGAHGLFLPGPLQRGFRDIFAAGVHRALNWDTAAMRYGKLMSGQPPDKSPFH